MSSAAFQMFRRSCSTSLSSRTLARPRLSSSLNPVNSRRGYAETSSSGQQQQQDSDSPEEVKKEGEQPEPVQTLSPEAEKLKAKEVEVVDLTGRLRYLQADFLNLQRNSAREKEQTRDFAITRFASDLLETVDVLEMALKSVPPEALNADKASDSSTSESSPSPSSESQKPPEAYLRELHTGVSMTQRQLLQTLFKYHVKPFDPTGEKFDPNRHEALYQAPIPGKEPGTVAQTQKTGYMIKDRVLRAAQVGVVQDTDKS